MQASTSYSRAHAEPFRSSTRPQWSGSGSQRFHHRQHRHAVIAQSERSLSPVSVETADSPTRKSRRLLGKDVAYVETGRPGYFTVDGKLRMQGVDPQLVWQILTSYEASARVFRNIDESTAHINEDGKLQVFQKAGWRFLAFSGSFECRLAVDEDAEARSLVFTLLQSSFMRDFEGRWSVNEEHVEGVGPAVLVEHQLSVMPMMPVPAPFAYYTRPIFVKQVEAVLDDLQAELDRLHGSPPPSAN